MNYLQAFQEKFNPAISSYLELKIKQAKTLHPQANTLFRVVREFIMSGGKRFRPALFYYAYESTEKKGKIDPLAASFVFELFHTFALLHDDIIDEASLRRGTATVNKKYGVPAAILSGDLALTLADEVFIDSLLVSQLDQAAKKEIDILYDAFKQELITGQYLDYIHIPQTSVIMRLKTSLYSFVRPTVFGFLFGGSPAEERKRNDVLEKLGILFQMKDDYEGVFSDEKAIGKSVTSDIEEGKNTMIIGLFHERSTGEEEKRFRSFFGKKDVARDDFSWLKKTLRKQEIDTEIRHKIRSESDAISERIHREKNKTPFDHLILELASLISDFS